MSKLITLTLLVLAAAIALVAAADEKYVRFVTYQDSTCSGSEVSSQFRSTECLFYDVAYTYYGCESDGVYRYDCGTDSFCAACTKSRVVTFACSKYLIM